MQFLIKNKKRILILFLVMLFKSLSFSIIKMFRNNPVYLNNWLDSLIPFVPTFVYFYILWFLLLVLIPLLLLKYDKKVFDRYVVTAFVYTILEIIIFLILPTTMDRAEFTVTNLSTWIISIIYKVDYPVRNLLPSGHCSFAYLFIMSVFDLKKLDKKYKIIIMIVSLLIVLSTLFIKQHVVVDLLGSLVIIPIYLILRKKKVTL